MTSGIMARNLVGKSAGELVHGPVTFTVQVTVRLPVTDEGMCKADDYILPKFPVAGILELPWPLRSSPPSEATLCQKGETP